MPTGAELFARTLTQLNLTDLFTLVGDHLNEALAQSARHGIRVIDVRHESGATHAADAWARTHRRPSAALVTGGPGHTNALTGIAAAHLACSPVIAISGSRASTLAGRGAFQDVDQVSLARPITKWSAEVPETAAIPFYLARAYAEANSGRKGPVHLTIPVDHFTRNIDRDVPIPRVPELTAPYPAPEAIRAAADLLRSAERPVVIAGSGAWWAHAEDELTAFIDKTGLPIYTIGLARGIVPDTHPLCMGHADPALNRAAREAFREADLVLVVGKRLDFRLAMAGPRLFSTSAKFIQIDIHAPELGLNRELAVAIHGDARAALSGAGFSLLRALAPHWLDHLRDLRRKWEETLYANASDADTPLHPAAFFAGMRKALPRDVLYSWDGGDFVHWGRAMLPALHPGGWMRLGPLGGIGAGLPNGIALQLAHPDRRVVVVTGDGALGFYIAELDTAVRLKLPLILVVGNDAGWGLERELQGGDTVACELLRTRYDLVMQGFGGAGETIETLEQIAPAFARALTSKVPYCLNVMIRGARSPFTSYQMEGKAAK